MGKKRYLGILAGCMIVLLGGSFIGNYILHKNHKSQYVESETGFPNGVSEVKVSKDNRYSYYVLKDGNCRIISYNKRDKSLVEIPDSLDGHKVTGLGGTSHAWHQEIKKIIVPKTIQHMEDIEFGNCKNLKVILFKGDVKEIRESCFENFKGTIYAKKNSNLINFAKRHSVKWRIYK